MKPRPGKRPTPRAIAVHVEDKHWKSEREACRLVHEAATLALSAAGRGGRATVLLTGDAEVAGLNRQFRGRDKPTNVLSFPSGDTDYLGDVAIAYGVVAREARAQAKSLAHHAAHLSAHGILHLLGYDHERARDAHVMEGLERRILAELGIADPYRKAA